MATDLHSINTDQRLYVKAVTSERGKVEGYTCLGFDVAEDWGRKVAAWAGVSGPVAEKGTAEAYAEYLGIMAAGGAHHAQTKERCPALLEPMLIGKEGRRVEVVDRYGERRRFYVGKSTGWLPIHLEIKRQNSTGGGGVTGSPFRSVRVVQA